VTDSPSDSQSNVTLSPAQAKFLYWFTGLIPIPKALTPLATYWGDVRKPHYDNLLPAVKAARLYHNVVTDVGRQTVTCTFQLVSYFVGGNLIKLGLRQVSPPQEDMTSKDEARQQVIVQVSSLLIQVAATILSRPFGASQLIRLFHQEEKPAASAGGKWQERANQLINKHLRDAKTQHLLPGKAALLATGGIAVYLGTLVAALYGLSTLLEKAFPASYNPKKTHKPTENNHPPQAPTPFSVQSPSPFNAMSVNNAFPAPTPSWTQSNFHNDNNNASNTPSSYAMSILPQGMPPRQPLPTLTGSNYFR
jgi:hypothetical protein